MDDALQVHLTALRKDVGAARIPSDCKHTAGWFMAQLPALYAKLRQTSESRYGEEITRLVQGVLFELAKSKTGGVAAQQLAASITDRLRLLHEQVGLPGLRLKSPGALPNRKRKVG
jgi:hypothetical protein